MKLSEAAYWVAKEDELNGIAARRSREILQAVAAGIDVPGISIKWDEPEPGVLWVANKEVGVLVSVSDDGDIWLQRHDGGPQQVPTATLEDVLKGIVRSLRRPPRKANGPPRITSTRA